MSTPATPTTSAPAHTAGTTPSRPAQAGPAGQRQTPVDLFATLLALAADAAPGEAAADPEATLAGTPGDAPAADDAHQDNPLAGLLMWQPPAPQQDTRGSTGSAATPTGATATAANAGPAPAAAAAAALGPDAANPAKDASAVDPSRDGSARPDTPAQAPVRAPGISWQVAATRAAQSGSTGAIPAGSDAPATRWSRAQPAPDAAAQALPVRSTVTLDARFPAASAALPLQAAARAADATEAADDNRLGGVGEARHGGPAALAGAGPASADPSAGGFDGGEAGDSPQGGGAREGADATDTPYAALEGEAVEVQHWAGTHGLRHASLRVGDDAAQAIDIQLALRGDELRLDIRTDDAPAREALREQAQASLGERLQQGGLQLGEVSVGGQQQQAQRDGNAAATAHSVRRERAEGAPADAAAPAAPSPRRPGTGALDVFA